MRKPRLTPTSTVTRSFPAAKPKPSPQKRRPAKPPIHEVPTLEEPNRNATASLPESRLAFATATSTVVIEDLSRGKRVKRQPGESPFPEYTRPTPEECFEVNRLLISAHGDAIRPDIIPEPDQEISGCGEVPSVLDALLRTMLSAATSNTNSAKALQGLIKRFGTVPKPGETDKGTHGKKQTYADVDRGSVDWNAVRRAPKSELFAAIKAGGLGEVKSTHIKDILDQVWEEGEERKNKLRKELTKQGDKKEQEAFVSRGGYAQPEKGQDVPDLSVNPNINESNTNSDTGSDLTELSDLEDSEEGELSLEYIRELDDKAAAEKLTSFKGVGVKTASCVLLYCLNRNSFAVDTHVWRLTKYLGWVPQHSTPNTAFQHLDLKVPEELKYSLHSLFIRHGRQCKLCRAGPEAKDTTKSKKEKKEKVELAENGEPVKTKKIKKWVGNGVMKQTLVEVEGDAESGELEQETCVIEHLVNRVRAQKKHLKKNVNGSSDGEGEHKMNVKNGQKATRVKSKLATDGHKRKVEQAADGSDKNDATHEDVPKPKRVRKKHITKEEDSDYASTGAGGA